mmetsp:Transcript_23106/g.64063  ORF Transcript_23106/g.64063 Transcript_23106/m.64063 type:complete len:329 (-) Transcript_23106:753-1739(-)|eukprot:CAMPEP_0172358808 /NCGR_PEP_ID=MMETSP1060-20121228/3080_1 /TAXON_ID=37318 /ORGANISM="Pseudo-nitzschia pungens, Strain cf. cingulata" /LENGTH=328 /DNA_ID=CAMNT_0013080169 /DNA_START=62 /DNA_END=1048 /DNA_ORIENTATION=+
MNDRRTSNRCRRQLWGEKLRQILLGSISLMILSQRIGCVLSFQPTTSFKRKTHQNIQKLSTFDRCFPLKSTTDRDSYVEEKTSTKFDTFASCSTTRIVFPGGGIFFYYQAGLVTFLRERYDLSNCTFSGASAGALTATLTAADVDFYEATDLALKLAKDAGVWDRTGGLQGIWGPMIEEWLDALLPTCIEPLQDRITLLVTPVPSFGKTKISKFEDRKDLIRCNMASVHLPWFLDGKLTSNFRDRPHIDGSFLSKDVDYIPDYDEQNKIENDTIILDWSKDPAMSSKGGIDIVEALSPDGIYGLIEKGKLYGKIMEQQGAFESLTRLP